MKPVSILTMLTVAAGFLTVTTFAEDQKQDKDTPGYDYATRGTVLHKSDGGFIARILIDEANLGSDEVEIAELTFPVGYTGGGHLHDAIEIFYVLSGRFGHNVNGKAAILEPGELGIVKPGDTVEHSVHGDTPAVVLTIWAPGGAAAPDFSRIPSKPIAKKE